MVHELYHALRNAQGTADEGGFGTATDEDIEASKWENQLLKIGGFKERERYAGRPIPTQPSTGPITTAP